REVVSFVHAPAALVLDGTIVVGVSGWTVFDGAVQALAPDGTPLWRFEGGAQPTGSPIVGPDAAVYYGFNSGSLVALEPTGQLRWQYVVEGGPDFNIIVSTPALASDGTLYFGGAHWLHALGTNGQLRWRFDAGTGILGAPLIAPDGTVYFVAGNEKLI